MNNPEPKAYSESLANFIAVYSDKKFEQYKIFDFRVKNQLILK